MAKIYRAGIGQILLVLAACGEGGGSSSSSGEAAGSVIIAPDPTPTTSPSPLSRPSPTPSPTPTPTPTPISTDYAPPEARNYVSVFAEEFTAPIDVRTEVANPATGRWNEQYWYGSVGYWSSHNDYAQNTMASVAWSGDLMHDQRDGIMKLLTRQRPANGSTLKYGNQPYLGAILTTERSFEQRYGYFEARLKAPDNDGNWPSFWLWGKDRDDEIDIFEAQTKNRTSFWASTHQRKETRPDGSIVKLTKSIDISDRIAPDASGSFKLPAGFKITDWHVYGLLWTKDEVSWFFDGVRVKRMTGHSFNYPMFIILTNGVGGWDNNNGTPARFPTEFSIDYVKVTAAP